MRQDSLRKRLFTVKEAGEYLGLSVWGIRERIWAGSLPAIRDGRRVLLDIFDLDKWITDHKVNMGD